MLAHDPDMRKDVWDNMPYPYTIENAEQRIAHCQSLAWSEKEQQFGIFISDDYAGHIWWEAKNTGRKWFNYHFWYRLWKPYRGQWYMTQIVKIFTEYVFSTTPCHRLYTEVFAWNKASCRVLEKNWFMLEWTLHEAIFNENQRHDEFIFGKIKITQ